MKSDSWQIRRLQQSDVHQLLELIRAVRSEFGMETRIASLLEPDDYAIFDVYQHRRSAYFVAVREAHVLGGAGIFPLPSEDWSTCELQRMYLRSQHRGQGIGQSLLNVCRETARSLNFQRCYAQSVSEMSSAIAFYERNGFQQLAAPLGESGHSYGDFWMLLNMGPVSSHL